MIPRIGNEIIMVRDGVGAPAGERGIIVDISASEIMISFDGTRRYIGTNRFDEFCRIVSHEERFSGMKVL